MSEHFDITLSSLSEGFTDPLSAPSRNLFERFYHEEKLHVFFNDLCREEIVSLEDAQKIKKSEALKLSPLDREGQEALDWYENEGFIQFQPE